MYRRTLLLLAGLCTLAACDSAVTTTAPRGGTGYVDPAATLHGVRGVLRQVTDEGNYSWQLELLSGAMLRLVGGPAEMYEGLRDKEVFVIGRFADEGLFVQSVEEDTRILLEFNRRR